MMTRHEDKHEPSTELLHRQERLAELAHACLQRERADDRKFDSWKDKKPNPSLVRPSARSLPTSLVPHPRPRRLSLSPPLPF
jgi:hypothetical protein